MHKLKVRPFPSEILVPKQSLYFSQFVSLDRAYRIGQTKDVQVIRLVARGTIDELKYLRQLYKVQLKQETLEDVDAPDRKAAPHLFRGVQGDKDRKGELFGCENLIKFKDGSFLEDVWKQTGGNRSSCQKSGGLIIQKTENVLQDLSEEHCDRLLHGEDSLEMLDQAANEILGRLSNKGKGSSSQNDDPDEQEEEFDVVANAVNHQDLFRVDRGRAAIEPGEDGFDEEMGGASQNVVAIYERGLELPIEDPNEPEAEFDVLANAVNHQDLFRDDRGRAAIEQGEDGFDEEMGGESQNVVALYERSVELPENPQDASEEAASDGDLSVPNSPTRGDVQDDTSNRPSPIVVRPMPRALIDPHRLIDDDAMRRVQQDRAVQRQAADLRQRRKSHSLSKDANADEQPVEENAGDARSEPLVAEDVDIPLVAKMPENGDLETPIKYQLMGKLSTGTHITTLSEADLALPSYGSKRKKKKSKKKSS
jgi:hypothetical protein